MFDFQRLSVYQKTKQIHKKVMLFLMTTKGAPITLYDQLSRASLSVRLNIAEGSGRRTKPDKNRFFTQARASLFESVSCLEAYYDIGKLSQIEYRKFENEYEEISKMLYALMR